MSRSTGSEGYSTYLEYEDVLATTDKAVKLLFSGGDEEWIPLSCMPFIDSIEPDSGPGKVRIMNWFIDDKELSDYAVASDH